MLDQETKKHIDSARNILVGKVPDPKAQVDQITTALIYKFMHDMDQESIELGGRASFFTGDFKKYGWSQIIDKKLSGQERFDLYTEAIDKLPQHKTLPQLFKDVFKNAFLPYRDHETLNLFLKEIDWFSYNNSENLGNAYEYLLSILGSQGDAGQFRTPRHIIDFTVEVLDPKKTESVLDPACGTGGFLISSYKHIIKHNSRNYSSKKPEYSFAREEKDALSVQIQSNGKYKGEKLKPTERKAIQKNFQGYDISPDMVKLSLVNMYLHKFKEPKISEYDTLTSEERWGDEFDVILANPPFMTPKGGIRPHHKFSVQANRSEVLFVDYIAEHLAPHGKAGIIVPEGIIFRNDTAYKILRKTLVEDNFLWAVVSLPAKVFEPYSGVKTSILFLDRKRAKKNDEVLFIDVQNDGFELGTTRRKIEENDLLEAFETLRDWRKGIVQKNDISFLVKKKRIIADKNYNLSGNLYRPKKKIITKWPMVKLGDVLSYEQPIDYIVKSTDYKNEYQTPVLTAGKSFILGYTNEEKGIFPKNKLPVIIFDDFTTATQFIDFQFKVKSSAMKILLVEKKKILPLFAYQIMKEINFNSSTHKRYWISEYSKIQIPLPPLSVQKKIVAEINGYKKIIDGAKQVVENWKPVFKIDPKWPMVKLGDVCEVSAGNSAPQEKDLFANGVHPFCRTSDVGRVHISDDFIDIKDRLNEKGIKGLKLFKKDTILFPKSGASTFLNHRVRLGIDSFVSSHLATISTNKEIIISKFLFHLLCQVDARDLTSAQDYPSLKLSIISHIKIPLPPLEVQKEIVAEIEKEQSYIDSCKKLIEINENKIKQKINEVWNSK